MNWQGSLTTKHGIVHAVETGYVDGGYRTVCVRARAYQKTPLDDPMKTVTCVWCVTGKRWPSDLKVEGFSNPCGEIALGDHDVQKP